MSSEILLKAKYLSKTYTGTVHPFATLCHALFGRESKSLDKYPVLFNIDLEIRRGETVGIMGRNGAGKTTLLGILGNVIQASNGSIERHGRIATLLGLTAGFNSNFTGRENAYLFCSIQGLSKSQADEQMAKIEAFADLGKYFDLPMRTYSSGMQSRLAFSCAVHVSADLIIIDETLAVGDSSFRMKCYDRIREMKNNGQTFLLVSHNQNVVANFCSRAIVLEGGKKVFDGDTIKAIEAYKLIRTEAMGSDESFEKVVVNKVLLKDKVSDELQLYDLTLTDQVINGQAYGVVRGLLIAKRAFRNITMNFGINNQNGIGVCAWDGTKAGLIISKIEPDESYEVEMSFDKRLLPGRYYISSIIHELVGDVHKPIALYQNFLSFEIVGETNMTGIANLDMSIKICALKEM